jgi:hypothetical protein
MMPNAKIVSLDKAPPEKISRKPIRAPPRSVRNLNSSSLLIPGVGTCAPIRIAKVKRTRLRNSGILKIF